MNNTKYYKKITAHHSLFDLRLGEIWRYKELIGVLTKRSFQVRYRQTILGPVWLLIRPIFGSFVTYLTFGKIAHLGTGEIPPILFYLTGNALWSFFSECLNQNAGTFRNNSYLFSKVYFPRLTMSISYIFSDLISFSIKMITVVAFMVYYAAMGELHINFVLLPLIPIILMFIGIMSMSIGILVSSLTTKYRDFQVLLGFVMAVWMPLTPVAYPLSEISNPIILKFFNLNPLTGLFELFRFVLFGRGQILIGNLTWGCSFTLVTAFFSIAVFNKVERIFADTI